MNTVIEPIGEMAPVDDAALPLEWAQWAEEPGKVIRLEDDGGAVVGRVHAVLVARGEAWIEGLWVARARRREGIGRQLLNAAEELVRAYGAGVIRAVVPAHNSGAGAVAARTGFEVHARAAAQFLKGSSETAERSSSARDMVVRRATALEVPGVSALIASGLKVWRDLVPIGWRFRRIGVDLVRGLARDGRVLVTQEPGGAAIVSAGRGTVVMAALVGSASQRRGLVHAAISGAEAARVCVFVPDASSAADLGVPTEPHAWCPDGLVIVQKNLAR